LLIFENNNDLRQAQMNLKYLLIRPHSERHPYQSKWLHQLWLFVVLATLSSSTIAQENKWQTFEEEWILDKYVSRHTAEMLMLADARKKVVEKAMGINVASIENIRKFELLNKNAQSQNVWVEEYLNQTIQESAGKITEEKPPSFKTIDRDGITYLRLTYSAKITEDHGDTEPGFMGKFDINRPAFKEGDTLLFFTESTKNTWLYIFNVTAEGEFSLMYPNTFERESYFKANTKNRLPLKDKRYAFIAEISNGGSAAPKVKLPQTEILYALYYQGTEPLFTYQDGQKTEWSFVEFNKLLLQIPKNKRVSQLVSYTVYP
jgi:hypothetical protein